MTDIDRIRERHIMHADYEGDPAAHCAADGQPWPCDTRIETERADRLAEALHELLRRLRIEDQHTKDGIIGSSFLSLSRAQAEKALRQHEGTSSPDNPTEPLFRRQRNRHPDGTPRRAHVQERHRRAREYAVVAAAVRWRQADTADPSMWPDEQRELALAVDALLRPETGTHQTPEPDVHVHSYIWSTTGTSDHHPPASAVCECGHRFVEDTP